MSKSGMYGMIDPALIVLKQNAAGFFRGRHDSPAALAAQNETVFSIFKKNDKYFPVNLLVNQEEGDLDSSKLASPTLDSLQGAQKYMDVPLKAFNCMWFKKDDAALGNKSEALGKINDIVEALTEGPVEGALEIGVTVYSAAGTPLQPFKAAGGKPAPAWI